MRVGQINHLGHAQFHFIALEAIGIGFKHNPGRWHHDGRLIVFHYNHLLQCVLIDAAAHFGAEVLHSPGNGIAAQCQQRWRIRKKTVRAATGFIGADRSVELVPDSFIADAAEICGFEAKHRLIGFDTGRQNIINGNSLDMLWLGIGHRHDTVLG